jgi:hypothetical protein
MTKVSDRLDIELASETARADTLKAMFPWPITAVEAEELYKRVSVLEAERPSLLRRALIWDAVSLELGVCYEPTEDAPGDTAIHDIREMRANLNNALRQVEELKLTLDQINTRSKSGK